MRIRLLAAAALAAAGVATGAGAANAACVGTDRTVVVCVNPPGVDPTGGSWDDCVHVGVGDCIPVSVPFPTVNDPQGPLVTCRSDAADPCANR